MPAIVQKFLSIQDKTLYQSFADTAVLDLDPYTFGDTGIFEEIHAIKPAPAGSETPWVYLDRSEIEGSSIQVGLGKIDQPSTGGTGGLKDPNTRATSGSLVTGAKYIIESYLGADNFTNVGAASNATGVIFTATGTTPTTWASSSILVQVVTGIAFDSTPAAFQSAIRSQLPTNYSAATVTSPTANPYPWRIDRATLGSITDLEGFGDYLTPDSWVRVDPTRLGSAYTSLIQTVSFIQKPAAYANVTDLLPEYGIIPAIARREGSPSRNEIQRVVLPAGTYGGQWTLECTSLGVANDETIETDPILFGDTEANIQAAIIDAFNTDTLGAAVTGNEVTVTLLDDYTLAIAFTGENVRRKDMDLMNVDASGLMVPVGWGPFQFNTNTASAASLLVGLTELTGLTYEIQMTDADNFITTPFQSRSAILINDLINPASTGSTEFPTYPTLTYVDSVIANLFDTETLAAISAAGTTETTIPAKRKFQTYRQSVSGFTGTHNIDLDSTNRVDGDKCEIILSMAAASGMVIVIRDNGSAATLWTENASGFAYTRNIFFSFNGTAWESDQGAA